MNQDDRTIKSVSEGTSYLSLFTFSVALHYKFLETKDTLLGVYFLSNTHYQVKIKY
jgi:hypothetical protein